jgi:acyl dehydratase
MGEPFDLPESFNFSVRSRGRTITEGDFSLMTNLTWTTSEIHTNKVLMAESPTGERLLAGACVLAFALGLSTPAIKPELESRGVRLLALLGYEQVRFRAPLRPGDTVFVESKLASLLRTSRSPHAVVNCEDALVDTEGRTLCTYVRSALCDIAATGLYRSLKHA